VLQVCCPRTLAAAVAGCRRHFLHNRLGLREGRQVEVGGWKWTRGRGGRGGKQKPINEWTNAQGNLSLQHPQLHALMPMQRQTNVARTQDTQDTHTHMRVGETSKVYIWIRFAFLEDKLNALTTRTTGCCARHSEHMAAPWPDTAYLSQPLSTQTLGHAGSKPREDKRTPTDRFSSNAINFVQHAQHSPLPSTRAAIHAQPETAANVPG
jgi:hypothetical protein